jgi:hypothetical protein
LIERETVGVAVGRPLLVDDVETVVVVTVCVVVVVGVAAGNAVCDCANTRGLAAAKITNAKDSFFT